MVNHKILFVDDEENILKALRRLLRKSPYETFFKSSGQEAIECLKSNEISILVTDMRMPKMNGVELIMEANKICPLAIKTILSGYSDINDIMKAINSGHVHNYIKKPWNESELIISLMNAAELYEKRVNEKKLINELDLKNNELLELNKNLEKKVNERTWELNANNLILNSIIEGDDQKKIMLRIIGLLSKISGNKKVAIYDHESSILFGSHFITEDSKIFKTGILKSKTSIINSILIIPLTHGDKLLGTIFINDVSKENLHFTKRLKNLNAILRMYISQRSLIANSADVIGSIDLILGKLDE